MLLKPMYMGFSHVAAPLPPHLASPHLTLPCLALPCLAFPYLSLHLPLTLDPGPLTLNLSLSLSLALVQVTFSLPVLPCSTSLYLTLFFSFFGLALARDLVFQQRFILRLALSASQVI